MSDSKSPNKLLNIWPNRFYRARLRNIRWERDMVKLPVTQEDDAETDATNGNQTNTGTDETTIEELESILNDGSSTQTTE